MTALEQEPMHLTLFVTGASPASVRAIRRIREICEQYVPDKYVLEIIDVNQQPALLATASVVAAPTLIRDVPKPVRMLVGDLSDHARVLDALGLSMLVPE